ncbi:MAG: EamA family transporter [bacterium]
MGIIYALSGAFFIALMNFFSKIFAGKAKNPIIISGIFQIIAGLFFCILIFFEKPHFDFSPTTFLLIGTTVTVYTIANLAGFFAFQLIDVSLCSIIDQLSLVVSYIGSLLIFSESNTLSKMFGVALIILGNIVLVSKLSASKDLKKGILLRLVFAFCGAIGGLVDSKIQTDKLVSINLYSLIDWIFPGIIVTFIAFRFSSTKVIIKDIKKNFWGMLLMSVCAVMGTITIFRAYANEEKSIVNPILKLSTILVIILGIVFLKERKNLKAKFLATVIVFSGLILVSIS